MRVECVCLFNYKNMKTVGKILKQAGTVLSKKRKDLIYDPKTKKLSISKFRKKQK